MATVMIKPAHSTATIAQSTQFFGSPRRAWPLIQSKTTDGTATNTTSSNI
jgi:hypothetical protein